MNKINNDRGISLIEIVIALAIMSLLMTAVVSLMSSNTIVFRKTKSDIEVQNQAESTFNTIADSVHSAKAIYAEGYILDGDNEIKFNSDDLPIDATTFQVKDDAVKKFAKGTDSLTAASSFESLDGTKIKKVYLTKLVVLYAAPIDFAKEDDSVEESPRVAELEQIEVSRDAEALPKAYVAKADRAYAVVRYTVKLVAKDTQYFNNTMKIKYNNGYAFSQTPYSGEDLIVDFDTRYSSYKFEPLSSSMHFITIIDVPREVMTNTQASLYVEIYGKSCKVR